MPPTSRARRSPQRKDRRSRSRSRSRSSSGSRSRSKKKSYHKGSSFAPSQRGQFRSRSRSPPRKQSRSPSRIKSHKYAKYQKARSRSLSPPHHGAAAGRSKGGNHPQRGVPPTQGPDRKTQYRSQSHSSSRSVSRSRSPSPAPMYGKSRKRTVVDSYYDDEPQEGELSPRRQAGPGDRTHYQYTGKVKTAPYKKPVETYSRADLTPSPPYQRRMSPSPATGVKREKYSDVDLRAQRYGVSSTTDLPYAAAPPGEQKKLLSDRFRQDNLPPLIIDENITIGIHRKLSSRGPISNIVLREFNSSSDFVLLRHRDEGRRPLFSREELKSFRWDDKLDDEIFPVEEHRIITIAGSSKPDSDISPVFTRTAKPGSFVSRLGASPAQDMDYRTTSSQQAGPRDSWRDGNDGGRQGTSRMDDDYDRRGGDRTSTEYDDRRNFSKQRAQPQVRLDPRPDPRYEHVYRQHEYDEKAHKVDERKFEKIQRNPNDLRHNLMKRHERHASDEGTGRDDEISSKFMAKARPQAPKDSRIPQMSRRSRSRERDRSRSRSPSRSRSRSRDRDGGKYRSRDAKQDRDRKPQVQPGKFDQVKPSLPKNRDDMTWRERVDLANRGKSDFQRGRGRGRGFVRGGRTEVQHEHDNRDSVDYRRNDSQTRGAQRGISFRGRGRAGRVFRGTSFRGNSFRGNSFRGNTFRGTGTWFRGNNQGGTFRGYNRGGSFSFNRGGSFRGGRGFTKTNYSNRSPMHHGTWKHDLYDKLEKDEDQKPTSTTEK